MLSDTPFDLNMAHGAIAWLQKNQTRISHEINSTIEIMGASKEFVEEEIQRFGSQFVLKTMVYGEKIIVKTHTPNDAKELRERFIELHKTEMRTGNFPAWRVLPLNPNQ